jgi:hypothetical protein
MYRTPFYKRKSHKHPEIIKVVKSCESARELLYMRHVSYFGRYVLLSKFPALYDEPNILNAYWCYIYVRENINNPNIKLILPDLIKKYIGYNGYIIHSLLKHHPSLYRHTEVSYYIKYGRWPFNPTTERSSFVGSLINRHGLGWWKKINN